MKIKVCGMREADNIRAVSGLNPGYLGFICYNKSPRFIAEPDASVLASIPQGIIKTAVFVNETAGNIGQLITKYGFAAIQLHGSETPEFCAEFKGKVMVIKAFGVDDAFDFEQLLAYANHVDYFLFDTKTAAHGGSGKVFDWNVLKKYTLDVPFFLSGGIGPDNIDEIKNVVHPQLYGVDLNSRFEISPGIKNIELLNKAFKQLANNTHEIRS